MKIERLISVFDKKTDDLINEVIVDEVPLDLLKLIFRPNIDDPLMYGSYKIGKQSALKLNKLLNKPVDFDFKNFWYFMDCQQLPPYEFGKKST